MVFEGHSEPVLQATFSPDGRSVATASLDGTSKVWDLEAGRALTTLRGHRGGVSAAKFSNDGARVLTAGSDGSVRRWRFDAQRSAQALLVEACDKVRSQPEWREVRQICEGQR